MTRIKSIPKNKVMDISDLTTQEQPNSKHRKEEPQHKTTVNDSFLGIMHPQ